ncbi:MAG: hypothetical protein JWO53_1046 [Chlamydiia bacterium]|nr:hypothetical protein [Chlamydiia bacterium]
MDNSTVKRHNIKIWTVATFFSLFVAYSLLWFGAATFMQKKIEDEIATVNQKTDGRVVVKCTSIEKSGYPLSVVLTLVNPKIEARYSTKADPLVIEMKGDLTATNSIFGQLEKLSTNSKTHLTIPGKVLNRPYNVVLDGNIVLQAGQDATVTSVLLQPLSGKKEGVHDFNLAISSLKGMLVAPNQKDQEFLSIEKAEVQYQTKDALQTLAIRGDCELDPRFLVHSENEKVTADKDVNMFINIFNNVMHGQYKGKTRYKLDVALKAPDIETIQKLAKSPLSLLTERIPQFSIDVKKFDSESAYGAYHHKGLFTLSEDEKKDVSLVFENDSSHKNSKEGYESCMAGIKQFKDQVMKLKSDNEYLVKVKDFFNSHFDEVQAIIPKFYQLNTILFSGKGSVRFNKASFGFSSHLADFGFTSDLYGILLNADVDNANSKLVYSMSINLTNYQALIRDMIEYLNHVITIYNACINKNAQQVHPLSKDTQEKILTYLGHLSDTPKDLKSDLKISVKGENNECKIGSLDLQTFIKDTTQLRTEIEKEVLPAAASK